jgi:hypothetical protein
MWAILAVVTMLANLWLWSVLLRDNDEEEDEV